MECSTRSAPSCTASRICLRAGRDRGAAGLQGAGYLLVVITNQSGIARGLYAEAEYLALTAQMRAQLQGAGVRLDAVQYCPHLADAPVERYRLDCDCRKPKPGMLTQAIRALDIDPQASFIVGDRLSDVDAGRAAGLGRCFLVTDRVSAAR